VGGICISGTVYDQIKTKLALGYEDMGAQAVKNIAEPVHMYRVQLESELAGPTASSRNGPRLEEQGVPCPLRGVRDATC
jgi:class 3 adenylate cyclase